MAEFGWPLEMAPTPMLPNGMSQQQLYQLLKLRGLQAPQEQFVRPPPMWQVPQGSPEFNDPTNWLGDNRNAFLQGHKVAPQRFTNALARYGI